MKKFNFKKIDAFATTNSKGNPAGYIKLSSKNDITESEMQCIAEELKGFVNEVGYTYNIDEDTFELRYFSSEREVEFCGHATIAIMYDIIKDTNALINKNEINIITNKGGLIVENKIKEEQAVFITSPVPIFHEIQISENDVAMALRIDTSDINKRYKIEIVNAGLETLIVSINSLDTILNIQPDLEELKQFCIKNKIDIIEVFCTDVFSKENNYRTRVFAPTFGYLEDPATGSGNSAFGYYLLKYGEWNGKLLTIEQNKHRDKFNVIKLKTKSDENDNIRVLFGGGAISRIEGVYLLA